MKIQSCDFPEFVLFCLETLIRAAHFIVLHENRAFFLVPFLTKSIQKCALNFFSLYFDKNFPGSFEICMGICARISREKNPDLHETKCANFRYCCSTRIALLCLVLSLAPSGVQDFKVLLIFLDLEVRI